MHGVNRNEEELKQRWGDFILMIWSIDPLNFCPWRRMRQMRTYNSLVIYYRVATRGKLLRKCMSFCCPNSINSLFTLFYDQAWNPVNTVGNSLLQGRVGIICAHYNTWLNYVLLYAFTTRLHKEGQIVLRGLLFLVGICLGIVYLCLTI